MRIRRVIGREITDSARTDIVASVANVAQKSYVFLLFVTTRYIESGASKRIKIRRIAHFYWRFAIVALNHA